MSVNLKEHMVTGEVEEVGDVTPSKSKNEEKLYLVPVHGDLDQVTFLTFSPLAHFCILTEGPPLPLLPPSLQIPNGVICQHQVLPFYHLMASIAGYVKFYVHDSLQGFPLTNNH